MIIFNISALQSLFDFHILFSLEKEAVDRYRDESRLFIPCANEMWIVIITGKVVIL